MILKIAGLSLVISDSNKVFSLDYSPCHERFLAKTEDSERTSVLQLQIEDTTHSPQNHLSALLHKNEIWELWHDIDRNFVFTQPMQVPQRWVFIDPLFQHGKIVGNFNVCEKRPDYPLQYIDIVIFSNWLANFGDLILHASGIVYQGEGYCFLGESGAGKSTLVRDLAVQQDVIVLGEDQIILRKEVDQFMVYGTPWHETPEMCSPLGVPLKKIFFLDKEAHQVISNLDDFPSIVKVMQTAFYPIYRHQVLDQIMDTLSSLPGKVSFHALAYKRGTDVFKVIVEERAEQLF